MVRRCAAKKRVIAADYKYNSSVVSKFVNVIMKDGKKSVAERILYFAIEQGASKVEQSAMNFFDTVIENVRPNVEVRSRRVGGATYQVPIEVKTDRSQVLAMRYLVTGALGRSDKSMKAKICAEMIDAYNNKGNAVRIKEEKYKVAEANRAFATFKW